MRWSYKTLESKIVAARDIEAGEEITISCTLIPIPHMCFHHIMLTRIARLGLWIAPRRKAGHLDPALGFPMQMLTLQRL